MLDVGVEKVSTAISMAKATEGDNNRHRSAAIKTIEEFRERFFDTEIFFDQFAGSKFADYLFAAHQNAGEKFTENSAHRLIEEAQLFIEAVHSCYNRIRSGEAVAS